VGFGAIIRNRKEIKSYWQHILWANFAFLTFIQNWWGIWPRTAYVTKNIFYFFFALFPIFLFYLVSIVLFPDFNRKDHSVLDMKVFFYDNTRWFFGLLTVYFIFTIVGSYVYEDLGNVQLQNTIRLFGVVMSALAAIFDRSKILHVVLLVIGYAALIRFFAGLPT